MKKIMICSGLIAAALFLRSPADAKKPCDTNQQRQHRAIILRPGYIGHVEKDTSKACAGGGYKKEAGWIAGPVPSPKTKSGAERKLQSWADVVAGLFAAPAHANQPAIGQYKGYRDYNNQSGTSGRRTACAARLDACFGAGHQSLPASAPSPQECVDFCDGNMPNPVPNNGANIACSIVDCQIRCNGWRTGAHCN